MKILIQLLIIICFANTINAQGYNWNWVNGTNPNISNSKIKTDNLGNVFVLGTFSGTTSISSTTLVSNGSNDALLLKYNSSGILQWAKNFGGSANDYITSLMIDANNDICLAFIYYSNTLSIGTTTITNSSSSSDAMLLKIDNNGNYLWHKTVLGTGIETIENICKDNNNNIIITGISSSSNYSVASMGAVKSTTNNTGFIAKFSNVGTLTWLNNLEANNSNSYGLQLIVCDNQNNIYVEGYSSITPSVSIINIGTFTLTNNLSGSNDFVIKYNPNGMIQWIKPINSNGYIGGPYEIIFDNNYNFVIVGSNIAYNTSIGTTTLSNNGGCDAFVAKFDTNMNPLWAKTFGSNYAQTIQENYNSVAIDGFNNIITVGYILTGTYTFANTSYTNTAPYAMVINKYNFLGNEIESAAFGSSGNNQIRSIHIDNTGYYYIAGSISSSTVTIGTNTLNSNGMFLAKGAPTTLSINKNSLLSNLLIYPNPCENTINIELNEDIGNVTLTLFDLLGRVIKRIEIKATKRNQINIEELKQGIYLINIETQKENITSKFIKN